MDITSIIDSNQQLKYICEDLQAVQTVITMAEDHPVYSDDHEVLIVVRRALEPIISDLQNAIQTLTDEIDEEPAMGSTTLSKTS